MFVDLIRREYFEGPSGIDRWTFDGELLVLESATLDDDTGVLYTDRLYLGTTSGGLRRTGYRQRTFREEEIEPLARAAGLETHRILGSELGAPPDRGLQRLLVVFEKPVAQRGPK